MNEPRIIPGTHRLDGLYKSHTMNSGLHHPYLKCQSSYAILHNLATKGKSGTAKNNSQKGN